MTFLPPIPLNSITDTDQPTSGRVAICGSHGGMYPACLAFAAGLRAVIFNDAGGGLNKAGIAGIMALDGVGMAAAAVAHDSCRIADAPDMARRGIISAVNRTAAKLGVATGQHITSAADCLAAAPLPAGTMPDHGEARQVMRPQGFARKVVLVDSAALVTPDDRGCLVITGSHGGLIGGDPARALKAEAALAVFNDAGGGCDGAGTTRLGALDERGLAALTIAHSSARIGDAMSAFQTGIVSNTNRAAAAMGIRDNTHLYTVLAGL